MSFRTKIHADKRSSVFRKNCSHSVFVLFNFRLIFQRKSASWRLQLRPTPRFTLRLSDQHLTPRRSNLSPSLRRCTANTRTWLWLGQVNSKISKYFRSRRKQQKKISRTKIRKESWKSNTRHIVIAITITIPHRHRVVDISTGAK